MIDVGEGEPNTIFSAPAQHFIIIHRFYGIRHLRDCEAWNDWVATSYWTELVDQKEKGNLLVIQDETVYVNQNRIRAVKRIGRLIEKILWLSF